MKRFLSLLTVFVLAFALAVPVGAIGHNGVDLPSFDTLGVDMTEYPNVIIISSKSSGSYELYFSSRKVVKYSNDKNGDYVAVFAPGETNTDPVCIMYTLKNGSWSVNDGHTPLHAYMDFFDIVWTNRDIYDASGNLFFEAEFCDGSSCPAVDVNINGVCDDCRMALMSLSRSPVAPDVTGNNKNYVMFYSGTVYQYTAYTSDSSYTIRGEEYGARYRTYLEPSVTATRFQSYDGINWEQTYNGTTANDYPGEVGWELISSTYDWYTEEGEHFFPVPLWEEVEKVTQGGMSNLTTETAGTMTTLVVCGVGLMALLMVLSLFGKRWLLFLR